MRQKRYKQVNSTLGMGEPSMTYLEKANQAWPFVAPRIFGGELFDLTDCLGRVVLLCFWRSSSIQSINGLANLGFFYDQPYFGKLTLLAINCDEYRPHALPEMISSKEAVHLWDDLGNIRAMYHVSHFPTTVIIDKEGFVRDEKVGGPIQDWVRIKRRMIKLSEESYSAT